MDFGSKLKELRKQAGMTQKELGDQIGVTKSVISFYELRERTPSPEVLVKFACTFHVTTDYLLGIDKTQTLDLSGLSKKDIAILQSLANRLREKTHCD